MIAQCERRNLKLIAYSLVLVLLRPSIIGRAMRTCSRRCCRSDSNARLKVGAVVAAGIRKIANGVAVDIMLMCWVNSVRQMLVQSFVRVMKMLLRQIFELIGSSAFQTSC